MFAKPVCAEACVAPIRITAAARTVTRSTTLIVPPEHIALERSAKQIRSGPADADRRAACRSTVGRKDDTCVLGRRRLIWTKAGQVLSGGAFAPRTPYTLSRAPLRRRAPLA